MASSEGPEHRALPHGPGPDDRARRIRRQRPRRPRLPAGRDGQARACARSWSSTTSGNGRAAWPSTSPGTSRRPSHIPGDYGKFIAYSARFYAYPGMPGLVPGPHRHGRRPDQSLHRPASTGTTRPSSPGSSANEPRRYPQGWIDETAAYIKSLDPNHMVTTGSGGRACPASRPRISCKTHSAPGIDYVTIHIWPQNWGWYDPEAARRPTRPAEPLGRGLFPRSWREGSRGDGQAPRPRGIRPGPRLGCPGKNNLDPASPTTTKDLYYAALYQARRGLDRLGRPGHGRQLLGLGGRGPARACPGSATCPTSRPAGTRSTTPTPRPWPSSRAHAGGDRRAR
ncbi:MAG: hypothetical protein M0C28_06395 [Candidatus Moduliflexus flocculans]|nr:hypothetical protein [Candidatus Moduliflexus flocculans]